MLVGEPATITPAGVQRPNCTNRWPRILGIKRTVADLIERAIKARIVRPHEVATLFEEGHLRRFLSHFEIDCVFDVGANDGAYATMLRNRAAYTGPIISFEPNPDIAVILKEKARRDPRWFVEEVALGSLSQRAKFNVTVESELASLHEPQFNETDLFISAANISRVIDVTVSTLEIEMRKYWTKLGFKRPFLKMDTQGHDLEVALGAGKMLGSLLGSRASWLSRRSMRIRQDTTKY